MRGFRPVRIVEFEVEEDDEDACVGDRGWTCDVSGALIIAAADNKARVSPSGVDPLPLALPLPLPLPLPSTPLVS